MAAGTPILPGRYEEPRLVGRGGMGEIYLARDRLLGRTVAVKLLAERLAEEPELRERFRREALTAARLSEEPHVVTVYDVGEHAGRPFTVMEYLPGGTLAERAQSRPVEPERALAWLAQAAAALDAAHGKGVVHRDVKPANLLFDSADRLQVVDFGIARVTDDTLGLTAPGTILGTAGYLAPEQALGRETTAASDRYALAVVAYELLTGGRPFARGSETAEAAAQIHDPVPPASERAPWLPPHVDQVFARALAKNPVHRYPSSAAFLEALREALRDTASLPGPHPPRRHRSPLVALALAGAVLSPRPGSPRRSSRRARRSLTGSGGGARDGDPAGHGGGRSDHRRPDGDRVAPAPAPGPQAAIGPEEAADVNDEAFALMQDGRWEEALPLLEGAVRALRNTYSAGFPYEAYAEYNLGRTLEALGRCPQARRHLRRSERLQGEREEITAALERCGAGGDDEGDDD